MSEYAIDELVHEQNTKLVYVYDLFSMWTFFVELAAIEENENGVTYPALLFSHGELPAESLQSGLRGDLSEDDMFGEFEDDLDDEDYDMFEGDDSFEDMGFEENWN
jgi:hypothetical protein